MDEHERDEREVSDPNRARGQEGSRQHEHQDRDVHDPLAWQGQVMVSEPERAALRRLQDAGLVDVFRRFEQPPQSYSWWDYRMNAYRRKRGLRIDLILASPALAARCSASHIDEEPRRSERPSDHAPVLAEFV